MISRGQIVSNQKRKKGTSRKRELQTSGLCLFLFPFSVLFRALYGKLFFLKKFCLGRSASFGSVKEKQKAAITERKKKNLQSSREKEREALKKRGKPGSGKKMNPRA